MALEHLYPLAEKAYIEELLSPADIAHKLNCSESTIRKWMRDNDWAEKRKEEIKRRYQLFQQSKSITTLLGNQIENLLKEGTQVPAQMLNAYSKLVSSLMNVKTFEEAEINDALALQKEEDTDITEKTKAALKKLGYEE